MTAKSCDTTILEATAALTQAIQGTAEWREFLNAQKAAQADERFARMVARQSELTRIQNSAQGHGEGLDGKSLVEFITLREQIPRHELYVHQQKAGSAVVRLLQRINKEISQGLGLDFASNAAPRRGGCCG